MSNTTKVKGSIKLVYPDASGTYFKVDYSGTKPQHDLFHLPKSHENYNALYALALTAAVNKYVVLVRTRGHINPEEYASVIYMAVEF